MASYLNGGNMLSDLSQVITLVDLTVKAVLLFSTCSTQGVS